MIEPTYQPLKPQSEAELPEHGRIAYRAFKRAARKLRAEHRKLGKAGQRRRQNRRWPDLG